VRETAPSPRERVRLQLRGQYTLATKAIIAITTAAYLVITIHDNNLSPGQESWARALALNGPAIQDGEYYRLFTSWFVHYGVLHLFFNMFILWLIGQALEPGAGHTRFTTLYVVSGFAGSAGALLMAPNAFTGGASGCVFGVAAAATLVMQRRGVRFWDTGFGPLLLINLLLPFFLPGSNISVGGHVGGLIGGALAAEAMLQARKANAAALGYVAAGFIAGTSILLALAVA
jgi:membrane associated rhomboid family serine protease